MNTVGSMPAIRSMILGKVTLVSAVGALLAVMIFAQATSAAPAATFVGSLKCTIVGTARAETLNGTAQNDVICGLGGNDRIFGNGGNDTLVGGLGNDSLSGGAGIDILLGGQGSDVLTGGAGADRLTGGTGRDAISAGTAGDSCASDTEDRISGTCAVDTSGPTISDVVVPPTVAAGTQLLVSWRVSDPSGTADSSGSPVTWMKVGGANGWISTWCAFPTLATPIADSAVDGRYQASCELPTSVVDGTYTVFIGAADVFGNTSESTGSDSFTVVDGASDALPPTVTELTFAPLSPAPGEELVFRWRATDETGVSYVMPWAFGPNGFLVDLATGKLWLDSQSGILVSGTSQDGIYEIKLRVSPAAIAGTYTLWLSKGDTLGNKTFEPATKDGVPITFTVVK